MRIPYLVINNNEESFVYTDNRKIKNMFKDNENITVYIFKTINKYNSWHDVYEINKNGEEIVVKMFEDDEYTYSDLGCDIMRSLAKAEWNTSVKYPNNGWNICVVCGDITNEMDKCLYCGEYVCWDCSRKITGRHWESGRFCSDECFGMYGEEELGIEYNPEKDRRDCLCNRLNYILENFEKEELFNILIHVESSNYNYNEDEINEAKLEYENMTEKELLNALSCECEDDVCDALIELYENETDNYLSDILDGEAFVNNLDPNDSADEWFFED